MFTDTQGASQMVRSVGIRAGGDFFLNNTNIGEAFYFVYEISTENSHFTKLCPSSTAILELCGSTLF